MLSESYLMQEEETSFFPTMYNVKFHNLYNIYLKAVIKQVHMTKITLDTYVTSFKICNYWKTNRASH